MKLNKPMSFIAIATMTTEVEYIGHVTLQELIDGHYLDSANISDEKFIFAALRKYSKDLDGGDFVEREGGLGSWNVDIVSFLDK